MNALTQQFEKLIGTGNKLTYDVSVNQVASNFPAEYTPKWLAWEALCTDIIKKEFGAGSPQHIAIKAAIAMEALEWGLARFEERKKHIIDTLNSSISIINEDTFNELLPNKNRAARTFSNKVFIVHGHDDAAKSALEIFLKEIGLDPVVLHRQADEGLTIIEKFEKHSNVGYAFILLTPDECAYLASEADLKEEDRKTESRARPNVIFEFGYFVGSLGRNKVCCLHTGDVSLPGDVSGMIYKGYNNSIEEVAYSITKDLKAAGYTLN